MSLEDLYKEISCPYRDDGDDVCVFSFIYIYNVYIHSIYTIFTCIHYDTACTPRLTRIVCGDDVATFHWGASCHFDRRCCALAGGPKRLWYWWFLQADVSPHLPGSEKTWLNKTEVTKNIQKSFFLLFCFSKLDHSAPEMWVPQMQSLHCLGWACWLRGMTLYDHVTWSLCIVRLMFMMFFFMNSNILVVSWNPSLVYSSSLVFVRRIDRIELQWGVNDCRCCSCLHPQSSAAFSINGRE